MIALTRAELEDIWRNKPYGALKSKIKAKKKYKTYKVTLVPYATTWYEREVVTVEATSKTDATYKADQELRNKYMKDKNLRVGISHYSTVEV